jgi:Putative adhesin
MNSCRLLTIFAMVVWAAVALTAAPRAFSHRHVMAFSASTDFPAESCADLHVRFDQRDAVNQSEERTITKAEAPILRIHAKDNGGLSVEGWDNDSYSVTLCKAAEEGSNAESLLSEIHLALNDGDLRVSGPASSGRWAAHLLIRAPKASTLELDAHNGPVTLSHVDGNLKARIDNGPITVSGCSGELDVTAHNGPVTLKENSGKQTIHAENGPMSLALSGDSWEGAGLDARTTNGPVTLEVPSGYKSGVVLESDGHGPFRCRASVCSEGRKTWDEDVKRIEFGSGPTLVHVSTVNGPVSVR